MSLFTSSLLYVMLLTIAILEALFARPTPPIISSVALTSRIPGAKIDEFRWYYMQFLRPFHNALDTLCIGTL